MAKVTMKVNGTAVSHDVPDNTLLVSFLRETLRLTGTHIGCDTSQCACVVHVNGNRSNLVRFWQPNLRAPMLQPSRESRMVTNCTRCASIPRKSRPWLLYTRHGDERDRAERNKNLSERDIREGLEGNICRCTGYHNIVKSVQAAAEKMGDKMPEGIVNDGIGAR